MDTGLVGNCPCCWGFTACHGHSTSRQQHCTYSKPISQFSISSIFPAWWHFVKIVITLQIVDKQKQHIYLNNTMAQTWKNPSASTIFPFSAGLPRYLPMFRHHGMPKLIVKASLMQRSRGVTFPSLDGSLAEPRRKHKPLYVLTHICVFVHTYMCGHRCRYVNTLVKIVIYQEKTS